MGPLLVVVDAPGFDLLPRVLERDELMHVQALVTKAPVEGFDVGILHGFARVDEVERDAAAVRPVFERAGRLRPLRGCSLPKRRLL